MLNCSASARDPLNDPMLCGNWKLNRDCVDALEGLSRGETLAARRLRKKCERVMFVNLVRGSEVKFEVRWNI